MTPEEGMKLLADPEEWDLDLKRRTNVFAARRAWSPLAVSATAVVSAAVVAVLIVVGVNLTTARVNSPIVPAGTPTAAPRSATLDNGQVTDAHFNDFAHDRSTEAAVLLGSDYSVPWARISTDPDSPLLSVAYATGLDAGSTCGVHLGLDVVETLTSVTIAAVAASSPDPARCNDPLAISGGTYLLKAPVGGRLLFHAPLSGDWNIATFGIHTVPDPGWTATGPPKAPVLQESVSVTTEGLQSAKLGSIAIGRPIPPSTKLLTFDATACGGMQGTQWAGAWKANKPFNADAAGHEVIDLVTSNGYRNDALALIWIFSAEIPTDAGIRVGDSLDSLLVRFPDLSAPVTDRGDVDTYVLKGARGKMLFDVAYPGTAGEDQGGILTVLSIRVIPIDADIPFSGGDSGGSCKA